MAEATFVAWTRLKGAWPAAPQYWSFSSLSEAAVCPRRYALRRATYPSLQHGSGYPDLITEASIIGTAIHEGIETTLRAMRDAGCTSPAEEGAVETLRDLGGYTAIATTATQRILTGLQENSRMQPHLERMAEKLGRRTPEMRRAIQTLISRMSAIPNAGRPASVGQASVAGNRVPIGPGVYPEVALLAERERFTGRVDLLTRQGDDIEILDFKSGKPAQHHVEQVTLYGFLWMFDGVANPNRLPVTTLIIAYIDHHEPVPIPEDWNAVRQRLSGQIDSAERALSSTPPVAIPSAECRHCPVRHMCDEYWQSAYLEKDPSSSPFTDVEVVVREPNGDASWFVEFGRRPGETLLRATAHDLHLTSGQHLRILNAAIGETEDDGWTIVRINSNSEIFSNDTVGNKS